MRDQVQALIDNGYYIIPIAKGQKRPAVSGWQNLRITSPDEIMPYLDKGCGIGILTGVGDNPVYGIDVDSMDKDLVHQFTAIFQDEPIRIGKRPKALVLVSSSEEIAKMSSQKFTNGKTDVVHQLEILGAGQQFVAFGVHPDTGVKYSWEEGVDPLEVKAADLHSLDTASFQSLIGSFETLALSKGYVPKGNRQSAKPQESATDILMSYEPTIGLDMAACQAVIEDLDCEDYDLWLKVGMALHHEFEGKNEGLHLWNEWSMEGSNYKSISDLAFRYKGFATAPGRTPVTMRSIVHTAKEVHKEEIKTEKRSTGGEMYNLVNGCSDTYDLMEDIAPKLGQMAGGDLVLRLEAEKHLKERFKRLSGERLPVSAMRKALGKGQSASGEVVGVECPAWAKNWVYISESNRFLNVETGVNVDLAGFRGLFDGEMGDGDEGSSAAAWVLNHGVIPKADRRMYMPGASELFKMDGVRYVNSYSRKGCADLGGEEFEGDKEAAHIFKRHLELLVGGGQWSREVQLFANFLRYCAQHPEKHMTWAVLLQGGYGDGKSEPITRLMGRLVGRNNTRVVQAQTIEGDKFNGWAEGHTFAIIEEIKLHGHNRYDILNKLKPIITNDIIEIRRMHMDSYMAPNTGKYYITTNYKDALPVASTDRRYMILFSQFPVALRDDSGYFSDLFSVIDSEEGARAIGRWLLGVPYHKDFKPQGHAPHTIDKDHTVELSQDTFLDKIEAALHDSDSPLFGVDYVVYGPFYDYVDMMFGANSKEFLSDRMLAKYLTDLGYNYIGRKRLECGQHRVWMKGENMNLQVFTEKYELQMLIC